MSELDALLGAAIDVLADRVMTRDDLRAALADSDLGTPDKFGLDALDRLLHLTPDLALLGPDDVAHLPSLFRGIAWSVPVTASDARNGWITAIPLLAPLVDMLLDGDVAIVGTDDEALGTAAVDAVEVDDVVIDVVVFPADLLRGLAGQVAVFTVVDDRTIRAVVGDEVTATDAQIDAVRAAFEARATRRTITRPLDGVDVDVRSVGVEVIAATMVATDRAAFADAPVPAIDALVDAAGLSVQRGLVGAGDTDWSSLDAWLEMNRVKLDHELSDEQATAYVLLAGAPVDGDVATLAQALDDAKVAEVAWDHWTERHLVGDALQPFVDRLADVESPGVAWLRARQAMLGGATDDAIALLDGARESGHAMVLADLAGFAADRSEPLAAQTLLREAGVSTDVDLDEEYDPVTSGSGYGRELAEEIAPFAALRPRAMAGRNDPCPCGSGRKYKQCHLGNELHALEHRAGWLYIKMMRFMQLTNPVVPEMIAETIVSDVESADLRSMLSQSYLPVDMALHEGRVADRFLEAKRLLLPADEVALVDAWIASTRSVYEVVRSTTDEMDVIDLATRDRLTVRDTVPEEPLDTGWKVIGRLVPVGDSYRAYSGFLPVNDDMVDVMLHGFATRELDVVALTIGQIFQTAETQDGMQALFDDSVDETELRALIEQMAEEMGGDVS